MRLPFRIALICLATVLLATACSGQAPRQALRTRHFIVYHASGHSAVAERAGSIAESWREKLVRVPGFEPPGTVSIYLFPDRTSFAAATGVKPDDTVVGTARAGLRSIQVDASGAYQDIDRIIPHELVHVFVYRRLGGRALKLPIWMHEGLAKHLSEDWSAADEELLSGSVLGRIIPLQELAYEFPRGRERRAVAYVQSRSAVKYMVDKYGISSISDIFSEIEAGQPFRKALLYSIGSDPDEFEREWHQFLWDKHRHDRWMKLVAALVPALMAVFAILAFRARLHRKRRVAEEMEEGYE